MKTDSKLGDEVRKIAQNQAEISAFIGIYQLVYFTAPWQSSLSTKW